MALVVESKRLTNFAGALSWNNQVPQLQYSTSTELGLYI